jgi:hypothetical protein
MVRKAVYTLLCLFLCFSINAESRHALTVFISDYPQESGWNRLNSYNDKGVILPMLHNLGYNDSDIICLEDASATYSNIIAALGQVASKASKGDQVYIHFSCHGQQITDLNKDEALVDSRDKYDEALVPYDAYVAYGWNGYKGEKHLLDDTLNEWLNKIAAKVGKDGCVIMVADACHSGDLEREKVINNYSAYRGTFDRFELPLYGMLKAKERQEVSWISISACKDFQTNYECEYNGTRYGRLSLAISRVMKSGMTVGELIDALKEEYAKMPLPRGKAQTLEVDYPKNRSERVINP